MTVTQPLTVHQPNAISNEAIQSPISDDTTFGERVANFRAHGAAYDLAAAAYGEAQTALFECKDRRPLVPSPPILTIVTPAMTLSVGERQSEIPGYTRVLRCDRDIHDHYKGDDARIAEAIAAGDAWEAEQAALDALSEEGRIALAEEAAEAAEALASDDWERAYEAVIEFPTSDPVHLAIKKALVIERAEDDLEWVLENLAPSGEPPIQTPGQFWDSLDAVQDTTDFQAARAAYLETKAASEAQTSDLDLADDPVWDAFAAALVQLETATAPTAADAVFVRREAIAFDQLHWAFHKVDCEDTMTDLLSGDSGEQFVARSYMALLRLAGIYSPALKAVVHHPAFKPSDAALEADSAVTDIEQEWRDYHAARRSLLTNSAAADDSSARNEPAHLIAAE